MWLLSNWKMRELKRPFQLLALNFSRQESRVSKLCRSKAPASIIRGQRRAGTVQLAGANVAAPGKVSDPAFANERTWLGSSYFLQQLNLDPDRLGKRYGDGFAEQRAIDDQIMALTGRRYLSGYAATEAEFQALMDAGVAYAKQYQIAPGVALTAEQMASLTTDIVWLQTSSVTLPDGSVTQVIVPQVYLRRPKDGDLRPTGSLIAAADIDLRGANDSVTNSGILAGHAITVASAGDIKNLGGAILGISSPDTSTIALSAGRDITLVTTTQTGVSANGSRVSVDRLATVTGGTLTLAAGRDLTLTGAAISAAQDATLTAGRDLSASSIALDYSFHVDMAGGSQVSTNSTTQALASISAGRDLVFKGGQVASGGTADLIAGNNIELGVE